MNGKWLSIVVLVAVASLLVGLNSCGRSQELVSIQVQPVSETFGASNIPVIDDAGLTVQLRALGTYIHPPVTKDITSQVTWASNDTQMMTVDTTGLLTVTGLACGGSLISATMTTNKSSGGISSTGAVVTGYMTGNVVCFTSSSGGGNGSPVLTLTFAGGGTGTVTSNPPGLSCASPTPCLAQFVNGTPVTLTASPISPSVFGSWAGCDSPPSTNPCTLTLTANRTVTATFN
jgi:List-Bact-rpt repeat protein/Big-like domain-containing protein